MSRGIIPGDKLMLKKDVLPRANVREFTFVTMSGNKVVLAHETEYEWEADSSDIEWNGFKPPQTS